MNQTKDFLKWKAGEFIDIEKCEVESRPLPPRVGCVPREHVPRGKDGGLCLCMLTVGSKGPLPELCSDVLAETFWRLSGD
jgi:hypothetical protein